MKGTKEVRKKDEKKGDRTDELRTGMPNFLDMHLDLTPKQRKFADAYIKTGSAPEAALSAYNCSNRNSARVMGYKTRHNPKVRAYMQEQVLTETLVDEGVESLRKALRADKMITNKRGEMVATWPDWGNRIKAATHLFKLIQELSRG